MLTPPKSWIVGNGGTPGCLACKQIQETGKSHSRVHSKGCRRRYTKWASEQRSHEDVDPGLGGSSIPSSGFGLPGPGPAVLGNPGTSSTGGEGPLNQADLQAPSSPRGLGSGTGAGFGAGHPTGGQRYYGKRPPEPSGADETEEKMDLDIVGGLGEVLEVDFMVDEMWNSEEQAFWRKLGEARVVGADWFEVMAFGARLWQEVSKQPKCELSGASPEQEAVAEAMKLELEEMTRLRVGRVVSTEMAKEIEKSFGNRIMATRWVVSLKGDGRTRCRLVCKDFRSGGLTWMGGGLAKYLAHMSNLVFELTSVITLLSEVISWLSRPSRLVILTK